MAGFHHRSAIKTVEQQVRLRPWAPALSETKITWTVGSSLIVLRDSSRCFLVVQTESEWRIQYTSFWRVTSYLSILPWSLYRASALVSLLSFRKINGEIKSRRLTNDKFDICPCKERSQNIKEAGKLREDQSFSIRIFLSHLFDQFEHLNNLCGRSNVRIRVDDLMTGFAELAIFFRRMVRLLA